MSDIKPGSGEELPALTDGGVPAHGGLIPPEEGGEKPIRHFKDTTLEEAKNLGLVDVDAVDDPEALAALAKETAEPNPVTESITESPDDSGERPKRRGRVVALVVGGLAAVGSLLLLTRDSDSEQTVTAAPVESEDSTPETSTPSTTATTEVTVETTTPETVPPETGEAVLMDASTPEDLLEQLSQNLHCMFGANPMRIQEECMSYVVGDNSGDLTTNYSRLIIEYNDYRAENPDFEFSYSAQVIDSLVEPNRIVIVANVTDPAATVTERYTFRKVPITVVQAAPEDETRQVWVLQESKTLNPGEVSFSREIISLK